MILDNVKLFSSFSLGLKEEVSGETFMFSGEEPFAQDFLNLSPSTFLVKNNIEFQITDQFSLGFETFSKNEGRIKVGTSTVPVKISVLDFGVGSGVDDFSMSRNGLVVTEESGLNPQKNRMRFYLYNSLGSLVGEALSSEYNVEQNNHFWLTYNGTTSTVKLYINGVLDSLTLTGSIPSSLSLPLGSFCINRYALNDNQLIKSKAKIKNILLTNNFIDSDSEIAEIVNNPSFYIQNEDNSKDLDFLIIFDDLSNSGVVSVIEEGSEWIVCRKDGSITKGSKLLWERRIRFSDLNSLNNLEYPILEGENQKEIALIYGNMLKLNGLANLL